MKIGTQRNVIDPGINTTVLLFENPEELEVLIAQLTDLKTYGGNIYILTRRGMQESEKGRIATAILTSMGAKLKR